MSVISRHCVVKHFNLPLDAPCVEAWASEQRSVLAGPVTFGLLVCGADALGHASEILEIIRIFAETPVVVGCAAEGLIAGDRELEGAGGFCVALYHLPHTRARAYHLSESLLQEEEWAELPHSARPAESSANAWMLLAAAGNLSNGSWLPGWDRFTSGRPTFGGFVGNPVSGVCALFCDGEVYPDGAVALAVEGDVTIETVLSQGCRPVGSPWPITRADRNVIHQIGNRPILEVLRDTLEGLSLKEQKQARGNVFIGLVMNEYKASFEVGDFLVRNLAAIDTLTGSVAIATSPKVGQNLQFQIRDSATASANFEQSLKKRLSEMGQRAVYGACLCECIGRGSSLFGFSGHDVGIVDRLLPGLPLSGVFCNGELAPVDGRTRLHGYAASLGLFVAKQG